MIRVAIADDHAIVRAGLRQFLGDHDDLQIVAECATGQAVLDVVRAEAADVILLDIAMPDQSGIDILLAIKARAPALPVLMLSGYPEAHYATTLLRQGAAGYLNKDCDPDDIVRAIRQVAAGRRYITAGVAEQMAAGLAGETGQAPHEQLSARELQVFMHLARGDTVGQVAQSLSLSVKTVSTYRTRVLDKLGLVSNSDLTYYAMKNGLLD